ncbi:MAG TPA: hypothetical protein VMS76_15400 [Planctomycetota bacterium]|nr:hypothetical protein [Planctomycetota bacterium]
MKPFAIARCFLASLCLLGGCSKAPSVQPPDAAPLKVVIDHDLQPSDAWRLGRQPAEDGRNDWIEVESLLEHRRHHIVISIYADTFRHVTEFWLSGQGETESSIVARAQSIEVPTGSTWRMRDLEGTARINPGGVSDASAEEPLVVLEYEVTGDHSGSPVTWRGKVAVPRVQ